MTTETMLDRRLRELMAELAAPGDQSAAIDNVISVTRAVRPEPRWRALLKERPMRTNSIVIAGSPPLRFGLIFAVIALIGLLAATVVVGALVLRQPAVPPAYGPAGNGVLAYAESGDIVTTDAAGANLTTITTGPAVGQPAGVLARRHPDRVPAQGVRHDEARGGQRRRDGTRLPSRLTCSTTSTQSTGPRTVSASSSSATSSAIPVAPCPSSCSPPTAPDPASRSTSVTSRPNGWAAWRPPAGDEIVFRAQSHGR